MRVPAALVSAACPLALQLDPDCVWLGLEVKNSRVSSDQTTGTVEFVARYRIKGASAVRMAERIRLARTQARGPAPTSHAARISSFCFRTGISVIKQHQPILPAWAERADK